LAARYSERGEAFALEAWLLALVGGLAVALAGEALKSGLGAWFRRLDPDRVERCPACGSDQLHRRLTRRESIVFLPLTVVFALAFAATLLAGVAAALGLVTVLGSLGEESPPGMGGYLAGVSIVAVIGWVIIRWLRAPLVELRGRPPVRCGRCGHAFAAA
jgi:hypothetical protein